MLVEGKSGQSKVAVKKSNIVLLFFEKHVLGIMAYLSDVIDSSREVQPLMERRRCVAAIEEMIKLAEHEVSIALPQVRFCHHRESPIY